MPITQDSPSTVGYRSVAEEYRATRRQAWQFLGKGIMFLAVCLAIGQVFEAYELPLRNLVTESSFIAGWVALWRPMELFLYTLPSLRERMKAERPSQT